MLDDRALEEITGEAGKILGREILKAETPRQGMGSSVFIISAADGKRFAIKIGEDVGTDMKALELVERSGIDVPVPEVYGSFDFSQGKAMVMENVEFPLLEDVSDDEKHLYIAPMLEALKNIHFVRRARAGAIGADGARSWKDFLLFRFGGAHPWFDWTDIAQRDGVDRVLIEDALIKISRDIRDIPLPEGSHALLHTDFNQRNLFVNPFRHRIACIVDWSEAAFGDPLYDFARVHLFILHFDLGEAALARFYDSLTLSEEEKEREELYLRSLILEYIAWYSEKSDEFDRGRLALHQRFLREYRG